MNVFKKMRFGTLTIISSLLLFSAGIRVLGLSGAAFALDNPNKMVKAQPVDTGATANSEDLDRLLASFEKREASLVGSERRIKMRQEELNQAEIAIDRKMTELEKSESRLRELLAIADVAAEDDVTRLTSVYENMKPKAAAVIFEEMPPAFAAGFLSRMAPAAAASVMASLPPQTAFAISVVFAGRHAEFAAK